MSDPFGYEEEAEKEKKKKTQEKDELRALLKSKGVRKYFFQMFEENFIFSTTFTKSSETYVNEGKRQVALKHFNDILEADPFIFANMCLEFKEDAEEEAAQL